MESLTRTIELEYARADGDAVPAVLSTETPVDRGDYIEVLEHTDQSVNLERAPLPLIEGHDASRVNIGIVDDLRVVGRKLRGIVRFGSSARARELLADVKAGIVRGLSIGYRIDQWRRDGDKLIATRFTPFELSAVAVPADPAAGFYRGKITMSDTNTAGAERTRASEILALGRLHAQAELAEQAVRDGASLEQFRALLLDKLSTSSTSVSPGIDWSRREAKQYSILRAIKALLDPREGARQAGFEIEVSRTLAQQRGREPQGLLVPWNLPMMQRDLTTSIATGTSKAGYTVATDLIGLIDVLRNKLVLPDLGVTQLVGLQGNVALPRKTVGASSYWVAENSAPTEGSMTFDQVTLTPKTCAAFVDFSRRFALQSTVDAEALVRDDLASSAAQAIEAAFFGSTVTNGPTGIRGLSGIGSVAIGTNGGAPTWTSIVNLQKEVNVDNAAGARMAYCSNDKVRAKLMLTPKQSSGVEGNFILGENADTLAGRKFVTTQSVPSNLTKGSSTSVCSAIFYGDWSQMVWGLWGPAAEILVDPYTGSSAGTVRVVCFTDTDFACRHVEALAAVLDVTTT